MDAAATINFIFTQPPLNLYNKLLKVYLGSLIRPYIEAVSVSTTMEQITDWIHQVFPKELVNTTIRTINNIIMLTRGQDFSDVIFDVMVEIGGILVSVLIDGIYGSVEFEKLELYYKDVITPWLISQNLTPLTQQLFGPASATLPITATIAGNRFVHQVTEEFAAGLVNVFSNPLWVPNTTLNNIKFMNVRIEPTIFRQVITPDAEGKKKYFNYSVTIGTLNYGFDTLDFMRGVITAVNWLGLNKDEVVQNFQNVQTGDLLQIQ
ncbi:Hypothetical protein HVR_LOCUS857 [uncultured virus]|nr:Hypothetical protein HVR_LOCUS857 [uncultured virus]